MQHEFEYYTFKIYGPSPAVNDLNISSANKNMSDMDEFQPS